MYLDQAGERWDPLDPALAGDLWANLRDARERCPVLRSEAHGGFVALFRYDDVLAAAQDWKTLCSGRGISPVPNEGGFRFLMLESDPPEHSQLRALLNPYFSRAAAEGYEGRVRELAVELIDAFLPRGECELVADLAIPLPGRVVYEGLLGAPRDGLEQVLAWLYTIVVDPAHSGPAHDGLLGWAADLLAERSGGPRRGDVIDALLDGRIGGRPLTLEEQANVLGLMLIAAIDNTTNTIANIFHLLATHPDLAQQLRAEPDLIDVAVEEFLRLEPSVPVLGRTATADIVIGGELVRTGERVLLYWAAANRDPAHFVAPETVELHRSGTDHLSFGTGVHRCIGRHIARLELRIAIEVMIERVTDISVAPGAEVRYRNALSRGVEALPLRFRPLLSR